MRQSIVFKMRADPDVMIGDRPCSELMRAFDAGHRSINQNSPPFTPVTATTDQSDCGSSECECCTDEDDEECPNCLNRSALPDWRSPFRFCSAACHRRDWESSVISKLAGL